MIGDSWLKLEAVRSTGSPRTPFPQKPVMKTCEDASIETNYFLSFFSNVLYNILS